MVGDTPRLNESSVPPITDVQGLTLGTDPPFHTVSLGSSVNKGWCAEATPDGPPPCRVLLISANRPSSAQNISPQGMLLCAVSFFSGTVSCACAMPGALQTLPPLALSPLLAIAGKALAASIAAISIATASIRATRLTIAHLLSFSSPLRRRMPEIAGI